MPSLDLICRLRSCSSESTLDAIALKSNRLLGVTADSAAGVLAPPFAPPSAEGGPASVLCDPFDCRPENHDLGCRQGARIFVRNLALLESLHNGAHPRKKLVASSAENRSGNQKGFAVNGNHA
ncbi:hypothetical protein TYRP_009995 [Tyrophagus putrescentiae]|nr:hypothetical protein TYRP_009995 [Tyrophagus putrescentiae]